MISVEGLRVEFSVKPLFANASFVVNDKDRIALVGKNGAGKSTLLKILCGQQQPTSGTVSVPQDTTIGYLPQVMNLQDDTTVRQETQKAFSNIADLKARVEQLERQMNERTDYESEDYMALVERYTTEHERYMMMGAESREAELERTLAGLGFTREDLERPTKEFSGGWRMRIELAKILLQKPDVLLLDEPTNHLDIESIQWLEQFLAQSAKAVVLVSHDRAFINNVSNRTLEISCGQIIDYKVKYDEYVVLRKERREQQLRAYENQQKEVAEMKDFIERFRYKATKAVQVQQKVKQLEKIVPIEVDEVDNSAMHLKFPPCLRSGDYPVICEEVKKEYAHVVFDHVNLSIKRGEKVAFVGKNGEGKSTLVKCIMNEIPFEGHLKVGHNVQIGYFAQNQAQLLDENLTVFQTIDNVAKGEIRLKINDILGAFMFGGEESDKKVKVLSGGERSRLAMIRLLLEPVNMLILDEPTNHLDIPSKEILEDALSNYTGTILTVSHDRYFINKIATRILELRNKVITNYKGNYDFYEENRDRIYELQNADNENADNRETVTKQGFSIVSTEEYAKENKKSSKEEYESSKAEYARQRKLASDLKKVEGAIERAENRIAEIDEEMSLPENGTNAELLGRLTEEREALDAELMELKERWEEIQS